MTKAKSKRLPDHCSNITLIYMCGFKEGSKGSKPDPLFGKSQSYRVSYASVTFALRRVYDVRTMSKSPFPCGLRRVTLRLS